MAKQPEFVSVRGANGINLYVTPTEPGDVADLVSCQNIDNSVRRAVLPRLGFGRPSTWQGLVYTTGGDVYKNADDLGAYSGTIASFCAGGGLFTLPPSVAT